jgi:hypothetical protein
MGFVSNSSSSSFIVAKAYLKPWQIDALIEVCKESMGPWDDSWGVEVDDYNVRGFTYMNNNRDEEGGLESWMIKNKFPMKAIVWENDE